MRSASYMPILKGRRAELATLRELGQRRGLAPLLEVPRIPWDFDTERPSRSISEHVSKFSRDLARTLPLCRQVALDASLVGEDESDESTYALDELLQHSVQLDRPLLPTTGVERPESYQRIVASHARHHRTGCVIRLDREDLFDVATLKAQLSDLISRLGGDASMLDVVIDLKTVDEAHEAEDLHWIAEVAPQIPFLGDWRSLWFAGGAFPEFLDQMKPRTETFLPRIEWTLWHALAQSMYTHRVPRFADYAIAHPISPEVPVKIMNMSVSLRYTIGDHWLVIKGRGLRPYGAAQFHGICRKMVNKEEYSGPSFSWGDAYIEACAAEEAGPGNATKWRQAGNSHHIALVLEQVDAAKRLLG